MTPRRWQRLEHDLIVTAEGICAICPRCGAATALTDDTGVDSCPLCGWLIRVTIEDREPWQPRGGAAEAAVELLRGEGE